MILKWAVQKKKKDCYIGKNKYDQPSLMAFMYLGALFSETRNTYQ